MTYRTVLIPVAAIVIGGAAIFGAAGAQAQGFGGGNTNFVAALAAKLGIGQDKVQSAMDSVRTDQQAKAQKNFEDRLTKAVKAGTITEAQKKLILDKHNELKANRDKQDKTAMTMEQRRAAAEKMRTDLEAWAKQNNIDLQNFFGGRGVGGGMGKGMRGGGGMMR